MGNWIQNTGGVVIMRNLFDIVLCFLVIWQFMELRCYRTDIQQLCEEMDLLLKGQNRILLLRTNNKYIQKLVLSINEYLEVLYQKNIEIQKIKTEIREIMINLSHDLKTPLTTISGYIQLLHIRYQEDYSNKQAIETIFSKLETKTEQTHRMITQFLDMAKIESEDVEIDFLRIDIGRLYRELIMEYYDILENSNIEVEIDVDTKPLIINTDKNSVSCIMHNFIDNALKYGSDGKFLRLSLKESEKYIYLEVEDHGQGISEKEQALIFNRNYRGKAAKQQTNNGLGVGLAICNKLAEKLHATIKVSSIPYKKTIFCLKLEKS